VAEEDNMEKLTAEEQAILERIASEGKPVHVRRARLLLLWDQGLTPKDIGPQVGLSVGRVRYWLRAFGRERMDVFPAELLAAAASAFLPSFPPIGGDEEGEAEEAPAEPVVEWAAELPEITVEELCQRYDVDMAHARHVADLALALFDLTAEVHGLPPERRDLLETAAILHNVGFASYPEKHHTVGRDIILEHRLVELEKVGQQMVACTTAFHRKKFKPKRLKKEPSFISLPTGVQDDTLAMAALIRMADGLDYSQSQTSALGFVVSAPRPELGTKAQPNGEAERSSQVIEVPVTGSYAGEDAARAQEKADMWHHLFDVQLRFVVEGEPVIRVQPEEVAEPEAAPPRKKLKAPGVLPDDPMSEAGRKVWHFHFGRMVEHEPGTRLGEDIEELHDMRVATRRMRSAFRVFSPYFDPDVLRPFLKGLKRTGGALGSVRDLDVFMEKAQRYLGGLPEEERSSLDPLLTNWREQREAARTQMIEYLDGRKYQQFVRDFGQFLLTEGAGALPVPADKPLPYQVCHVVPSLIYDRYQVVRGYETVIEGAPIETLHALRIDCKRLRYSLEFFQEVLGPEAKDVIREVVTIQDHLGNLHDADVACGLLVGFLDGWARAEQRERINVSGVASYLVAKQNELRELMDSFPEAWQHFNRSEVRHKLALAVSVL
jgi:CHAD domain-containing protein